MSVQEKLERLMKIKGVIAAADLLPALKGEGSLRTDHRFVVYRLHSHHLIASGIHPPRSARPAVDHGPGLRPITPIPHHGEPSIRGSLGLGDMWSPHGASPRGHTLFQNASEFKTFTPPLEGARLAAHAHVITEEPAWALQHLYGR